MPKVTDKAKSRSRELMVEIQVERQLREQELGWLFRPLAVCPFPASSPGKRIVKDVFGKEKEEYHVLWTRRAGNIKIEVLGHPDYGIPHGQDTLVILFLAYEARRQGSRKIRVSFYRDFMRMFEMNPNDGRKYRLVVESLQRIRNAKYSWEVEGEPSRERGLHFLYIDEYDLYCDPKNPDQRSLFDQYILLSERFWYEISNHHIPSNLKAIIALKSKPAHLNFYIWLSYRVGQAFRETVGKGQAPEQIIIPFWGSRGLQEQMSSKIEQKFLYRNEVKKWMKSVGEVWPNCPAELDGDALRICVTGEDQLDVQPKDTDAPRILPKPKPEELPDACRSVCPECGGERTRKAGRQSRKGYRMPDYWACAGGCKPVSTDALCPDCGQAMQERNKGRADYTYHCPACRRIEGGEAYWLKYGL